MSLTSDSGACSESSSSTDGGCAREEDVCDPEEEEGVYEERGGEEEDFDEEDDLTAAPLVPAPAAPLIRSYDDGIEFVSDTYAASAAFSAACDRHHRRLGGGGRSRGGGGDGRQSTSRTSRAHTHHRERARRERFIELYGKLQTSIPALQVGKRVTHRRILTETAVYLAGTIAQIKARRRVNKLRALLAQLEADAAYMRRFSGLPPSMERQHLQQQHSYHHQQQQAFRSSSSSGSTSRRIIVTPDDTAVPETISDCFVIG